ncbi:hypothetical protein LINPERPRIM_LOCUS27824 [Linum perenne]
MPTLIPKAFNASLETWHQRLGHANLLAVKKALSHHSINYTIPSNVYALAVLLARITNFLFPPLTLMLLNL